MTIRLVISPRQVGSAAPESRWSRGIRKLFNGLDKPYQAVLSKGRFVRRAHREPGGGEAVCVRCTVSGRTGADGASGRGISGHFGIGMCRGLRDRRGPNGPVLEAPWL